MSANNLTPATSNPAQREEDGISGHVMPAKAAVLEIGDSGITTLPDPWDGFFIGTIASPADVDLLAIELTAGVTYTLNLYGVDSGDGSGTLDDPFMRLLDSSSNPVQINGAFVIDGNSGVGRNAKLEFTATTTGTFYLELSSADGSTGRYTLQVEDDLPAPPATLGSLQDMATYLQSGYTNGTEYAFDTSSSNVITVDISGLTAEGQQLALWAMEAWEMVADLDFQTVTSGEMITVDDEVNGAFAFFPETTSIPGGVELNVSSGIHGFGTTLGSLTFQTYVQQFGQALGLGALGNYTSNFLGLSDASYPQDAVFTNDNWQLSVMSAFDQNTNPTVNASFGFVTSAMMVDILAIQGLYGAPGASGATAGNTIYGVGSNLGNYLDDVFAAMVSGAPTATVSGNPIAITLYDSDGTDLLDLSYLDASTAANIDLNGGAFSDIGSSIGMLGIAVGTVIENLEAGAGDDTLTGNAANNVLTAGAGNDLVLSGAGNDTTNGGSGNDTIYGGGGNDNLSATGGLNEIFGGAGSDAITGGINNDLLGGGSGNDVINGGNSNDTMWGSSGNDLISGGDGDDFSGAGANRDTVNGGLGNDTLYGGGGQDTVSGDDNDDLLGGGTGADLVVGGSGNDTLWGQAGNDTLNGGLGDDSLAGGAQSDLLSGKQGEDTLSGGFGNDTLSGGADNDVLNGNFGNDVLTGGLGADVFVFEDGGANTVTDFSIAQGDILQLDDALWGGGLSETQVVDQFVDDSSGTVIMDFGNGTTITLDGLATTNGLSDQILLF